MNRRLRKTLASALCLIAVGASVPLAHAAPKDADAQKLDKQAMDDDYLNVRFDAAEKKLRDALNLCGATGCTPKIKAQIYMHLGIIQVNAGKAADATAAFGEGLKLDPTAAPESDFSSDAVRKAYDAAKASAPAPTTTGTPPATGTATTPPPPAGDNDLKHEVITEGQVSIPVPVYVGAQDGVARYVLFYKAPGADFTKVEMKRVGRGFGAEIPCKDVKIAGPIRYYIQALDAQGDVVGSAGSKKQPIEFALKQKVAGELPAFPGKEPPAKCSGQGDCPPGMNQAGCEEKLSYGSKCTGPGQCNAGDGLACIDGTCQPGKEDSTEGPIVDDSGTQLPPAKLNLLSIGVSLDDAIVNGSNICSLGNASDGTYVCFRQDSGRLYSQFGNANTGSISGPPFAVGTVRVLLGYDRAIPIRGAAITPAVGVRIGYAFNGGKGVPQGPSEDNNHTTKRENNGDTKDFMPFHLEGRVTGFFGKNVLARRGVRPYAFLGGGLAQVDAKIADVQVNNDCGSQAPKVGSRAAANCLGNESTAKSTKVDAYRKMGTGFVGLGGGIMYAISPTSSLAVDVKVSFFFGSPGVAVSPTLGFVQQL